MPRNGKRTAEEIRLFIRQRNESRTAIAYLVAEAQRLMLEAATLLKESKQVRNGDQD